MQSLLKMLRPRELLKNGFSVRRALETVGLGWRNYYKYAPVIYMDPELPIPLSKSFIRNYIILRIDLEQLRISLNEVAKYAALDIARRLLLRGRIKRSELGRKWLELAQDLLKTWTREVSIQLIEQSCPRKISVRTASIVKCAVQKCIMDVKDRIFSS